MVLHYFVIISWFIILSTNKKCSSDGWRARFWERVTRVNGSITNITCLHLCASTVIT